VTELLVGPLLRFVSENQATIWVEVDSPCRVNVLGSSALTFHVEGHHYALVVIDGLTPGTTYEYEVELDGRKVWPEPGSNWPASCLRTLTGDEDVTIVFGSCRVAVPHEPPYTLTKDEDEEHGREIDALYALAHRLRELPREDWPDLLLMIGDQVYVDEDAPKTREFIRGRRDTSRAPFEEVLDFEEYTRLYREAWSDPDIRWLLSTVPSAMVFDDHDVHDDWNISWSWVEEMRAKPWWDPRITGAFMAYWVYQHIGNLSPPELAEETMLELVKADDDGGPRLGEAARMWDRESAASRWAYYRDFGDSRLLVLDSRAARVLAGGRREMVDEEEWDWIVDHSLGAFDHLVIASTLPVFMPHGIHRLEAWNEAVCHGRWGKVAARLAERLRRAVDLEHWAAFGESFDRLCGWLRRVATGEAGIPPPASIVLLGGDVHNSYVAEVDLGETARSRIFQIVCSPFRNPLGPREQRIVRVTGSRASGVVFSLLGRLAGVEPPWAGWEIRPTRTFENTLGELELDRRSARVTVRRSAHEGEGGDRLVVLDRSELAADDFA
jgi:hypothetical protein